MTRERGLALIVVSGVSFGGVAVLSKLLLTEGMGPLEMQFWRWLIAFVAVAPLALPRINRGIGRTNLLLAVLLGVVGQFSTSAIYVESLRYLTAPVASFLLFLNPVIVAVLASLFLAETVGRRTLVALALAIGGLALMALGPGAEAPILGVALGLSAAFLYASTIVAGRRLVAKVDPLLVAWLLMAGATVSFLASSLVTGVDLAPPSNSAWTNLLILGTVSTALSIATFYVGLPLVGAATASVVSTLEPVSTTIVAYVVLGEALAPVQLAGAALILISVTVVATRPTPPL